MRLVVRKQATGRSLRLAIAALLTAAVGLVPMATGLQPAEAAAVSCGWHLSTPVIERGAGSGGWAVSFVPDDPNQRCSTSITATAQVAVTGGGRPSNIMGNPSPVTVTADFTPGGFAPGMAWSWSPYCADPGDNLTITVSAGGQTSSTPTSASSCFPDFGGHSQITALPGVATGDFVVATARTSTGHGYWLATEQGLSAAYGDAGAFNSTSLLQAPIVGTAGTPSGVGNWLVGSDGGIFTFGNAGFYGSTGNVKLAKPVVGMAATPSGHGYWLVASDGGIFTFGDAGFYGSTGNVKLTKPVVGMAATPSGHGYWLVASDGGIFTFGDAGFYGSTGNVALNKPVVGMAATPSGHGYWLVASDGGIFTFGDAVYHGSTGGVALDQPVVGMAATPTGAGYWLAASDGGVFTFGDAVFYGSQPLNEG